MKAAILTQFNSPFIIGNAEPHGVGVRINVAYTGICGRDLVIWKGGFKNLKLPLILGHEIVGYYNGRPVAVYPNLYCGSCDYCKSGKENLCDNARILGEGEITGGYAEQVIVPERNLIPLPDDKLEKYAATMDPVATAIHASKLADLKKDSKVLVTGAGGGVGIHLVQYLKYLGISNVYGLSSKGEKLKELGVTPVSDIRGEKFDAIFELVGSKTINDSLRALKKEGILVLIGNTEGEPITLSRPAMSIMRQHKIVGSASYTQAEYEEAIKLVGYGKIKAIYEIYELERINEAYRKMLERKVLGRAILKVI
ncbi:alcohol dehydrogenase [Saccharolobus solfataricus]|uniref:Alcohol dehydrogenase (Zn containing) (Adh-13) n=3 Tax=Saccharolobus solfataricus TaxID=2287 RepID=Q97UW5_SACS2|nr:alcohol dehydrogenase catalytic domain-containing protein [Saccharolobus solfataricus]AAK42983.1 Alcohol dehydrogenase (Zn containing) (adh-13) [Saccharolobus solfataricus P2]AKA73058.1 alcohol dehydrogenase [Saccharolobus solfataricus]AKA75756.1 alcohol dehydrogenase [Saccharolobus solfataricus]AKA78448.1 alcohol dehydrogenase [Saccharolobus solfataricus]AZF67567.1 alcohol dehydrogenase [Saccharolobus solfataricus]